MDQEEIKLAEKLLDKGNYKALTKFLAPFVKSKDPDAINLISCFSSPNESESDFLKRHISQKVEASRLGSADASYRMGVNYLYGDDVERDLSESSYYFERAINQGHSYSKFTYGFSLYHGTDGKTRDVSRGLRLMQEAAADGIELAVKELETIKLKGT
ncbi:hypothetical protein CGH72_23050 [Vibrio parahaemolyticus]|uniref:tetratricopeptide repeat protein n=2 Tax=Vibrio parahaemolyticus TaxID=670 RepID=UPI00111FD07E|nr:SEL1-like repeat protein [Vibrio parahaemolyticus]TOM65995.1 hypothetical protein CGH72_23050 [Vibrio parahaemolyticus]TOM68586.1 hypothetical protein CGH73_10550 [Vibrio parahaemolyticus]TOO84812.1 hypothetical protein CGH29_16315 [Vibrio parahaemolyticus]